MPSGNAVCPRCMHPKWYTLKKKMSICLIALLALVLLIKLMAITGERSLGQWFGPS
jgi:hypothetical protein